MKRVIVVGFPAEQLLRAHRPPEWRHTTSFELDITRRGKPMALFITVK